MAIIKCAGCGARNRIPEDRSLRLRCARCKNELPNAFIVKQLQGVKDQLRNALEVLPHVATASQMRETEEALGRTADVYANVIELPLVKANPDLYAELMDRCEHLANEVQVVMGGTVRR